MAMVQAASELFRKQGYDATSWRQVTAASGSSPGSIGFLFPHGKEQLAADAVAAISATVRDQIDALLGDGRDPAEAMRRWITVSTQILVDSDYTDGCPIATLALEMAHRSPTLQREIAAGYDSWIATMTDHLRGSHGTNASAAAQILLSAFEGALLLSRAQRSTEPLDVLASRAGDLLVALEPGTSRLRRTDDPPRTGHEDR